ncbi:MAG: lipoyl(octanoyl) transferase LipB [Bauldia sp.]
METEVRRSMLPRGRPPPVEWVIADRPVDYGQAVAVMERRADEIRSVGAAERAWLVEHPPLYSAGTSAKDTDLLAPDRFPVYRSGRGGQYTYHGPGQRVAYLMLDLSRRQPDLRLFVWTLEEWIIRTLAAFDVGAGRRRNCVGVWVKRPRNGAERTDKIAAIGIRLRRWVSFHGIALNVDPALEHFSGIVPCGIRSDGVTSLADLGVTVSMAEVDAVLGREFEPLFGDTKPTPSAGE